MSPYNDLFCIQNCEEHLLPQICPNYEISDEIYEMFILYERKTFDDTVCLAM